MWDFIERGEKENYTSKQNNMLLAFSNWEAWVWKWNDCRLTRISLGGECLGTLFQIWASEPETSKLNISSVHPKCQNMNNSVDAVALHLHVKQKILICFIRTGHLKKAWCHMEVSHAVYTYQAFSPPTLKPLISFFSHHGVCCKSKSPCVYAQV